MEADEVEKFVQAYGFHPGDCVCEQDTEEGNTTELTECHAKLMDKFVDQCELLIKFIKTKEVLIGEQEIELNVLRAMGNKGGSKDGA